VTVRLIELTEKLSRSLGRAEVVGLEGDVEVTGVAADSRRVTPGTVFCALRGGRFDGNDFTGDAARRGAAAVMTDRHPPLVGRLPQLVVSDARVAMQTAARAVWGESARRVRLVGITGTNGKTTVGWLTREMLNAGGLRCGVVGTLGLDYGFDHDRRLRPTGYTTPEAAELFESLHVMSCSGVPWAALEVSSHALALGRVDGLDFSVGVFTNLTQDHLDFHGSLEAYRDAKAMLFERLGAGATAVLNREDATGAEFARRTQARVLWTGLTPECDVWAEPPSGAKPVALHAGEEAVEFAWSPAGRHNLENLASAAGAALAAGVKLEDVARAAARFDGVPGRLEAVDAGQDFRVYVDYAHTPDGLESVLRSLRPETHGRLICLFGCGGDRDRGKRPLMGGIAERLADEVIVTSDNPRSEDPARIIEEILAGMRSPSRARAEADREEAIRAAVASAHAGDVVLLAGKGHETEQIVGSLRMPFDDREVARAALLSLRRSTCTLESRAGRSKTNAA
jgi:UDP-N-acetylmuramoyl-L-alanyl-D-glutamate--2,6-diaminopimelate ligase